MRGPRSRAGFIAYPVVPPSDRPIAHTSVPGNFVASAKAIYSENRIWLRWIYPILPPQTSVEYQLPSFSWILMVVFACTEQRIGALPEGDVRIFEGGSNTMAAPNRETGFDTGRAGLVCSAGWISDDFVSAGIACALLEGGFATG
jgi:hypothetical protein